MKRLLIAGFIGSLAASGLLMASPAHAAVSGRISVPNIVRYDDCVNHPYSFHLDIPTGYTYDVTFIVDVTEPDGTPGVGDWPDVASTDGRGTLQFCGREMAGTYIASGHGSACDSDYNCVDIAVPATRFSVRKPFTRTGLTVKPHRPHKGQVVKFKVTSMDERPRGYYYTDYTYILLQKKIQGRWVKVRGSRTYIDGGPWVLKYRWTLQKGKTLAVRAVTPNSDTFTGSISRAIVLRTH